MPLFTRLTQMESQEEEEESYMASLTFRFLNIHGKAKNFCCC